MGQRRTHGQQRQLDGIINRLNAAMRECDSRSALPPLADERVDYTRCHFDFERVFVDQRCYRGFASHEEPLCRVGAEIEQLHTRTN